MITLDASSMIKIKIAMTPYEALAEGTVIGGKYKVERLIGAGGMGAVYLAAQVALGRKVAVKVLHPNLCSDPGLTARFHREASLAASIGHDNICEVTDFGIDEGGMPYLVMPLLKGLSLRDILKQGAIPYERLCDIMRQVLSALDAAHIAGVVHRDLKPDNIFIAKLGDRTDFVKLLDFGISKVMESGPVKELTQTGTVLGTADYMAPEQARGEKSVDHRLDIYAAGVILYEALTGKRPYAGSSYNEILLKIVTEECPSPSRVNPLVPKELEAVILKAMARNPADRFVGAKEMSEAVEKAVETIRFRSTFSDEAPTMMSNAMSPAAAPQPASNRKRRTIAVALVLLLIAVGSAVWTATHSTEPSAALLRTRIIGTAIPPVPSSSPSAPNGSSASVASADPNPENPAPEPALEPMPVVSSDDKPSARGPKPKTSQSQTAMSSKKSTPSKKGPKEAVAPPPTPPPAPPPQPSPEVYSNMNQLKAALRAGKITRLQYSTHQAEIRRKRAAEYDRLKADYRRGAITKYEYELSVDQVRRKYEGN
jgi:serine/threonine-protein kinase